MAHVNCPKCGKRLRLLSVQEKQGLRCPACNHEFAVSPPSQPQPLPGDYAGEGTGVFAKTSLAVLALLGIALIAVLIYKNAAGPGSSNPDPPAPIAAKDANPKPLSPKPKPPKEHRPKPRQIPATKPVAKPAPLSPEQIFAKASPAVVYIVVRDKNFKPIGLGSGFFIDSKGLIVTNHHVIKGAEFATALLNNKSTLFVDGVTAVDADNDLAILKVSGKGFASLKAADVLPKIGSAVYAIGNPRGLENTFSGGMVSGHREFKQGVKVIQTTTPISPGSSGGPLLNTAGEVVGVTTSYLKGSQNLNFAVPVATLQSLIGKQGKVKTLASAGGGQFDSAETKELEKAWTAMAKKDWTAASKILVPLRKTQKDSPFVWYALGYLHFQLGNHEIAIQHLKAAIALKPDFAVAYYSMGGVYRYTRKYDDAIAAYKKAVAVKPDFAEAYFHIGRAYHCKPWEASSNNRRYANAIAAYKAAIALEPNYVAAYWFMGLAYGMLERRTDAIAAYKAAIAIKPDFAKAYEFMGDSYGSLGRYTDAIAAYKKAVAIKPNSGTYSSMATAYKQLGQYDDAIAAYKKAVAIRPDFAEAYWFMGNAYKKLKQYADAITAYKKAITSDTGRWSSGIWANMARESIRDLQGK